MRVRAEIFPTSSSTMREPLDRRDDAIDFRPQGARDPDLRALFDTA
jgi:hypothetical protein